jgi:hypothetical protein
VVKGHRPHYPNTARGHTSSLTHPCYPGDCCLDDHGLNQISDSCSVWWVSRCRYRAPAAAHPHSQGKAAHPPPPRALAGAISRHESTYRLVRMTEKKVLTHLGFCNIQTGRVHVLGSVRRRLRSVRPRRHRPPRDRRDEKSVVSCNGVVHASSSKPLAVTWPSISIGRANPAPLRSSCSAGRQAGSRAQYSDAALFLTHYYSISHAASIHQAVSG